MLLILETLFQADEKEFPHMALIGYSSEKNEKFRCGGALISEQWVLSSVECSTDEELGDAKFIQLGGIKRKGAYEKSAQVFNIKRIVIHRHHSPLNIEHEIALYEMNEPATLSTYILPICLPQSDTIPIKIGTATGWNKMGLENKMSSVLKKINLNYFPMAKCEQYEDTDYRDYSTLHIDYPRMICAGTNSSCQSDPGSILQYCSEEVYCMYTITGVRARTNCTTDGVALYTKVFKYLDWIESFVWPNE